MKKIQLFYENGLFCVININTIASFINQSIENRNMYMIIRKTKIYLIPCDNTIYKRGLIFLYVFNAHTNMATDIQHIIANCGSTSHSKK